MFVNGYKYKKMYSRSLCMYVLTFNKEATVCFKESSPYYILCTENISCALLFVFQTKYNCILTYFCQVYVTWILYELYAKINKINNIFDISLSRTQNTVRFLESSKQSCWAFKFKKEETLRCKRMSPAL